EVGVAHVFGRLEGAAALEDGESREEEAFGLVQEVVAPLDGGAERSLPRVGVPPPSEEVESVAEPFEDLPGSEDVRSRSGELDRERHGVQARDELRDVLVRLDLRALPEELDRLRSRKRRHRILDLAANAQ